MKPIRPRMDRGSETALRSDLARMKGDKLLAALAEARASGDTDAETLIEYEMERRGLDE